MEVKPGGICVTSMTNPHQTVNHGWIKRHQKGSDINTFISQTIQNNMPNVGKYTLHWWYGMVGGFLKSSSILSTYHISSTYETVLRNIFGIFYILFQVLSFFCSRRFVKWWTTSVGHLISNSRKIFGYENSDYLISLSSFYKSQIIRKTTGKHLTSIKSTNLPYKNDEQKKKNPKFISSYQLGILWG